MDDVKADANGGFRRIEVRSGPTRRRRWSAEEKGRIVAETLPAGGSVSDVARRWQVRPQQVFAWRRAGREGQLVLPMETGPTAAEDFVPIVMETAPASIAYHRTDHQRDPELEPGDGGRLALHRARQATAERICRELHRPVAR